MRLADFISEHADDILAAWEPVTLATGGPAPRKHAAQMLSAIAADLGTLQTRAPAADDNNLASLHGAARLMSGFTIEQLLAEYRALRSSVLRLWSDHSAPGRAADIIDITRFNEAIDQALAESVARYSAMMKHSQHQFLAILGHDLRNRLNTAVVASSYLMRAPRLDPAYAPVIERIHRSGIRMGRLVDDLIDYTRTRLGAALSMSMTKANMGMICRCAVEELRLAHPQRTIHFDPDTDLDGIWDEGRIARVISILLGNALQHGSAADPVSIDVKSGGSAVIIRIHNPGKAIAAAALATIFDPLLRLAEPDARGAGSETSLGISLYIARATVEAHAGDIGVTSDHEHGTTFSVHLPRLPPPKAAASQ